MKIRKKIVITGIFIALVVFSLIFTACKEQIENEPIETDTFVAVTDITGVPTSAVVGTPLALTGTVTPNNATNKAITWAVVNAGTTGATINGNTLNTTGVGTVTVRAAIANGTAQNTNYTKDFTITITSTIASTFVAVTDITGVPSSAVVGTSLTLTGTITPSNATNQVITWTVENEGTTGATITDNVLNTTATGTVTIKATIANGIDQGVNFTKNFNITITSTFIAVTDITDVPSSANVGTPLTLTSTVTPNNATNQTITWMVADAGTTGATITGNTLNTTGEGTVTVRATIINGTAQDMNYTKDFTITISTQFVAVTNITGVPSSAIVGTPLTLTGSVAPTNATNKTINWTVANAGTTGATITGNTLNATGAGSATIMATIANGTAQGTNYVKDFTITITTPFVAVTDITGVPSSAVVGTPLTLTSTVVPNNATNQTISWTVVNAGTTGATITGSTLNTTGVGTVTVRATIVNGKAQNTNFTKDYSVTVIRPVTDITGVPTLAIIGTPLTLTATVVPSNATNKTITWTVANAGTTGATITDNTLNTTGIGTVTVKATIANGQAIDIPYTKDFAIIIRQNVEFIIDNFSDAIGSEIVPGTLRYALTNVQDGDTIRFSGVTPGVTEIALNSRLPIIENNIVIEGNGVILTRDISWTTIVSNDEGFMYIRRGSNITISRIHFKDSRTMFGGAIYNSGGNLTLESCIFSNNRSEHENPDVLFGGGGAITNFGGTLNVKGCTFYGNNAYNYGGAIASENINASMTFIGNLFYGNTAAGAPSAVSRYSGNPITSGGYNVVDVPLETGYSDYGWQAIASDRYFTTNPFSNTTTFEPVSNLRTVILTAPQGFPTTDFYGNVRTYPGAPGAVK